VTEPYMKKGKGDGVEINLAVWAGKGSDIFCVHGLTANCRCWDGIASSLSPRHRVWAMDLRGRGFSDKPSSGYSIDHHCRDIRALLGHLEIERVALLGHSLGAYISLAYAANHPEQVDRLILIDGGAKLSPGQAARVFAGIKPSLDRLGQVFPTFEAYLENMKKAPFLQPWSFLLETYFRHEVEIFPGGVRSRIQPSHIQEEALNLNRFEAEPLYRRIQCPTLILRAPEGMLAKDDILLPEEAVEKMVREIPNAKRLDLAGTNHFSILFAPSAARDEGLREFLAGGSEGPWRKK
jgi:pimeloyl-ACP methyl ester carboxylesterase